MMAAPAAWPYPFWIAHRGAGKLAPENTMAAFELGASLGHTCFECDVKLSSDDVPFLLHDADLRRTTQAEGIAGERPWAELATLDAGAWHGHAHAGQRLPTLQQVADFVLRGGHTINLEIKPTPGTEARTGRVVAEGVLRLWSGAAHVPLLSSFQPAALEAAKAQAPQLPRALLLDTFWPGWEVAARGLECVAIVCNHKLLTDAAVMAAVRQVVPKVCVYTVNDDADARRVTQLGVDAIITDAVDRYRASMRIT